MPTATRKRRARVVKDPKLRESSTTFHVFDGDGNERTPAQPVQALALVRAQKLAQDDVVDTFYVERHTLFGPPVELFRVLREEDGSVSTYTINPED